MIEVSALYSLHCDTHVRMQCTVMDKFEISYRGKIYSIYLGKFGKVCDKSMNAGIFANK